MKANAMTNLQVQKIRKFPGTNQTPIRNTRHRLWSLVILWSLVLGHWTFSAHAQNSGALASLISVLNDSQDPQFQLDVLRGISDALKGKRDVPMPNGWAAVEEKLGHSNDEQVRLLAQSLGLTFGSEKALQAIKAVVRNPNGDPSARRAGLDSLLNTRDPELPGLLQNLLSDAGLRAQAIRGLARFDAPGAAEAILKEYPQLNGSEKRDAMNTLASRANYARPLLAAVADSRVPRRDLTAEIVRQLRNLKVDEIDQEVQKVWGSFREASADKKTEIDKYKAIYRAGGSTPGDAVRGRAVFARTCQQCHTLFDLGGKVGPDITGSNRGDLQYVLENVVDPNAVIPNDYRASTVTTKDDRVITGIVKKEDANSVTIGTPTETLVLPRSDVESIRVSEISMMPEGLLAPLTDQEIRDLIYYLGRPGQVPLLATPETVAYFFNGKDLAGWDGNEQLWKVENGEIVGSSKTGLSRNEFLKSQMVFSDFRLICKVKLAPNKENSGIQFRSEALPDGEMRGCQADVGAGWWGKLYEEQGRGLLWDKPGEQYVNRDGWNTYEVLAIGDKMRTAINGHLCVDLEDSKAARQGVIGFQLHAGGPLEVRFKDLEIEVNPKPDLKTAK
jgi:putative heme-binding domain-containing protein